MPGIMIGIFIVLGLIEDHIHSAPKDRFSVGWRFLIIFLASVFAFGGFWWEVFVKN